MKTAEYMLNYASELAERIEHTFVPIHFRGDRERTLPELMRSPIGGQYDAILAVAKTLDSGQKTVNIIGEMGCGKSMIGAAAAHTHADGRPYRALVMCPPHLTDKWVREVIETIPKSRVRIIERYRELTKLAYYRSRPVAPEYFIVSESMAKLGSTWEPAAVRRETIEHYEAFDGSKRTIKGEILHCPNCHAELKRKGDGDEEFEYMTWAELARRRVFCDAMVEHHDGSTTECGNALFRWTHDLDRWPIASYIAAKCRGLFDYAILDECHEMCGTESAIAIAMSKIVQSVEHVLPLTGTYLNG